MSERGLIESNILGHIRDILGHIRDILSSIECERGLIMREKGLIVSNNEQKRPTYNGHKNAYLL